jgi:hypothetical protein
MNRGDIENIRQKLKQIAFQRFGYGSVWLSASNIAVDALCDAKIAEAELMTNTISSYSIQGRSITKRNLADIPWDSLVNDCLTYFHESEIPFSSSGSRSISVDFSRGAL